MFDNIINTTSLGFRLKIEYQNTEFKTAIPVIIYKAVKRRLFKKIMLKITDA